METGSCDGERHGIFPHKKTLFHTVAHFRGWRNSGQGNWQGETRIFFNEVKDLADSLDNARQINKPEK
jgi:hypothetical protein